MKTRLLTFIDALREAGVLITVTETLDAMNAVGVVGIAPRAFREGLAATLVKDEADRPCFDALFDRFFAAPGRERDRGERQRPSQDDQGRGSGRSDDRRRVGKEPPPRDREAPSRPPIEQQREETFHRRQDNRAHRLAQRRALQTVRFDQLSPDQIEECDALVAELAERLRTHLSRRQRSARRGRLDVRRTIRRSVSKGGVPIEPAFRQRQPGTPDLVALCDHSHSVATTSRFLIGLLTPAQHFFRRVRLFAFVDQPVEVSVESGTLVPHERLDLYARSDFGRVLVEFWRRHEPMLTRNTILLILGDARNNRRPPRAETLGRLHSAVRQVVWLNPEPASRWNTADSVMRSYQRYCDALLSASTIRELYVALRRTFSVL